MNILHGVWIPDTTTDFKQEGHFCLWVETNESPQHHLSIAELSVFLKDVLNIKEITQGGFRIETFLLPTLNNQPLSSIESYPSFEETEEHLTLKTYRVDCYKLFPVSKKLLDIYVLSLNIENLMLGNDFLFWYQYVLFLKQLIYKDQYIPALTYRELTPTTRKKTTNVELYYGWQWVSEQYESYLQQAVEMIPFACIAGVVGKDNLYDKETALRHFSEVLLHQIIHSIDFTQIFNKKIADTLLENSLISHTSTYVKKTKQLDESEKHYRSWLDWQQKLVGTSSQQTPFHLCFQLKEAPAHQPNNWSIDFVVFAKHDPSFKVSLADYWSIENNAKGLIHKVFGDQFEKNLLINLGTAARMYPKLWAGLETSEPASLNLTLDEAFVFLKESAWILEAAGFKIIVPAWWTPEGRQRMKIRLRSKEKSLSSGSASNKNALTLPSIISYQYDLAVGGEPLSEEEWRQLVDAKTPLVQWRGQWLELDRDKIQKMIDFWQQHGQETPQLTAQALLKKVAEEEETFELDHNDVLADLLDRLRDDSRLIPIEEPPQLQATLRPYQQRGVAWLQYLEQLGLNGCLADDMGLGKTMQVITHLLIEKLKSPSPFANLLIVPTSLIGNWQKEITKFSPDLRIVIHYGAQRPQDVKTFKAAIADYDVVVTSYTLARKDEKLLHSISWHRIVLDEAQNIKNPKAAQTKAILKFVSSHRLALTGTPVENRLLDLWSIFNFLNPNYLGKPTHFRNHFELPIQRDNDPIQSSILKRLVEPLILRRLKTDKRIIQDLPDKVENKQYCNLTAEQASLYEAVVKNVEQQIDSEEGIQRQGLILSTLMQLKQICNHPVQFLQDGSEFTSARSHKLERLTEMLEEILTERESALVFTQFTDIGEKLEKHLRKQRYKTYYLHGGTSRQKRETMITEFQHPETEPAVFILSVKAGGVGITLTKANHVFHFDRWWNPAVENQATDRAFRIGQQRNVFVHKFVTLGTLEERIDQLIEDKKDIANSIVGDDESWLGKLDNQRFKELISLNKQTILES